ncbi:hypothetical protein GGTG_07388 [Gaeumannomyces tritici R3-111a-1]|uniref:Uncharacterized protein n=1 Tax=Gaeumannomyces tritici (strain R3-111a-1) TaxID=644352 RepID=J3P1J0_GAET3|nr:hypothetical protein GGTG_07388 [Gaeumannomyces tritici R3-111a-1]EJT73532.1 hypothetical protein GGTG_07388 [Gaeumannomyces tritici R3-111a-1]
MPYLKEPKPLKITFFSLALQSLPLKSLAPKAVPPGANTNAAPLRGTARLVGNFALDALLDNGLTFVARKLFGRYGIKGFSFLDGLTGAKLGFNKLFEKFRYRFGQSFVNVLICLTTKTTATKYRTLRIIIFKKRQINKVLIIVLLKIDNFPRRERVADIYIKQKKGNVRFKSKSIKIKSVAAAYRLGLNIQKERLNTNYLRLQSLRLLEWLLNAQKGKKRRLSGIPTGETARQKAGSVKCTGETARQKKKKGAGSQPGTNPPGTCRQVTDIAAKA